MELEFQDVLVSSWRWLAGLLIGATTALVVALVARALRGAGGAFVHGASFFRALPILALVPVFSRAIGVGETSKVLLIAWACFFPVFISTLRSETQRTPDLELRISVARFSRWDAFRHYGFPRLLFGFLGGVEISIGIGWLTVVAAEFIGTFESGPFRGGLGSKVYNAFNNGNDEVGLACLLLFGILGIATSLIWRVAARAMIRASGFDSAALSST
jgi:ABC-type nitrate/sulfonate/bicarbonate transport system permease component